jgi:hypothetical protein
VTREGGEIAREIARVAIEVGGVGELQRIHEDRHHDDIGDLGGALHERQVPRVQGAHGGDEGDNRACTSPPTGAGGGGDGGLDLAPHIRHRRRDDRTARGEDIGSFCHRDSFDCARGRPEGATASTMLPRRLRR